MSEAFTQVRLQDGTLVRHKVTGYEGRIDGTTAIASCFTAGGKLLGKPSGKHTYQYRVAVKGESMRQVAPAEDLEIVAEVMEVVCPGCRGSFRNRPGVTGKPHGRCQCGGWICPHCLACQGADGEAGAACERQQKRLAKKRPARSKPRAG